MTTDKTVLYKEEGAVACISLNRPKQMNASSWQLRSDLREAINMADKNNDIRVVVLTGEGRGFSSGADLTEVYTDFRATINEHILKDHKQIIDMIEQSDKAWIAAINGPAAGVMLAHAFACDLIMMSEEAFLYCPFSTISLVPDGGVSKYLLQAFGYRTAFEMVIEGRRMSAQECLDAGVASAVVSGDDLRKAAMERAQKIADNCAPLSLKYSRKLLRAARNATREDITIMEADFQHICSGSEDFAEGVAAFLQKRKAEFKGR